MSDFLAAVIWYLLMPVAWLCRVCKHPFRTQWEEKSVGLYGHCVVCGALIKPKEKNNA